MTRRTAPNQPKLNIIVHQKVDQRHPKNPNDRPSGSGVFLRQPLPLSPAYFFCNANSGPARSLAEGLLRHLGGDRRRGSFRLSCDLSFRRPSSKAEMDGGGASSPWRGPFAPLVRHLFRPVSQGSDTPSGEVLRVVKGAQRMREVARTRGR